MFKFDFRVPTNIRFEMGALVQLGEVGKSLGDHALLVTGCNSSEEAGFLESAVQSLEGRGVVVTVHDGICSNPRIESILEGADKVRENRCNLVIALGGGSVMDAAKLISLASTHAGDLWEYRVTGSYSVTGIRDSVLPVITVPTTAGTGTETSPAALAKRGTAKEVFYSPYLFPKVALVDPSLAVTLPPDLTAQVGLDAIIQGLEAYVSSNATPFSDVFALAAVRIGTSNIRKAVSNGEDLEARAGLALAAIFSFFAINQAGVGAIHALSNPLSGRLDLHHGLAVGILLPSVLRYNLDSNHGKYAKVAEVLGVKTSGLGDAEAAEHAIGAFEELLEGLGLPTSLRELGITEIDVPTFAKEAQNPDLATNPKPMDIADIERVYQEIL